MSKRKEVEQPKEQYVVKVCFNRGEVTSQGETIAEALRAMTVDYTQIKTNGEVIITKGERSHSRTYRLFELRRMFLSKMFMINLIRNFERLFS
jgi:hypothetical protein